jgi:tRNA threonylcarbamoyladenosine biosynthesis protein TsaE
MNAQTLVIETTSTEETRELGARLAPLLTPGDVLALVGDLGSGKTTFTQGLARALGVTSPVTSPTFVLINRYRGAGGISLHHADCYRLNHARAEMLDAGLADLFSGDDIVLVEWADRLAGLLPEDAIWIAFTYLADDRRCIAISGGRRAAAVAGEITARGGAP